MQGVEEYSGTQPAVNEGSGQVRSLERDSSLPRHDGENSSQEEEEILSWVSQILLHHPVGTGETGALVAVTNTVVDQAKPHIEEDGHQEGCDLYPGLGRSKAILGGERMIYPTQHFVSRASCSKGQIISWKHNRVPKSQSPTSDPVYCPG